VQRFADIADQVAATTKKTEKARLVADYFRELSPDDAATAALFFSARVFPAYAESTLNVGGTLLWKIVGDISRKGDIALTAAYRRHGDLGAAAHDVLLASAPKTPTLSLSEVQRALRDVAGTSGQAAKTALLTELLRRAAALEAKYIIKIITGELRIGLRESIVEEAIALAYDATATQVQRANMLLGDIAGTLTLAAAHRLADARMRLFHPIGFMLASPADSPEEAFAFFHQAQIEDKYDGIRAQAHCSAAAPHVRLFSRTLDDVTSSFPELVPSLRAFDDVIFDGEIVAWQPDSNDGVRTGHALPFSELQKRLGRKVVSAAQMRDVPVAYLVFDVLYARGELLIDRPLHQRMRILDRIFAAAGPVPVELPEPQGRLVFEPALAASATAPQSLVLRAPAHTAASPQELEALFERARARGNEGLMIKDPHSPYLPGRRGRFWIKLKRELAMLDVVVTAVEYGHGKRAHVLSDYTFAVRDGDRLLNVGKAYSGLTDREIAEMTEWFLVHTLEDRGFSRRVEPKIVLEVTFNAVMKSSRHESGYALRFPRIVRLRTDKRPDEIDTLDRVREIFEKQKIPRSA
jgi:ATP-dependent DNA ligase I